MGTLRADQTKYILACLEIIMEYGRNGRSREGDLIRQRAAGIRDIIVSAAITDIAVEPVTGEDAR